jgi:hypothetical protein
MSSSASGYHLAFLIAAVFAALAAAVGTAFLRVGGRRAFEDATVMVDAAACAA